MLIDINKLRVHPDLQVREGGSNPTVVLEYAQAMKEGAIFRPITVYFDGSTYWIADGFHRFAAAKQIDRNTIDADVHEGSRRDAILHAVGANNDHGVRRDNATKRNAVMKLLNDKEWCEWSDNQIAKICRVGHQLVGSLRPKPSLDDHQVTKRTYTTKHGTTATMNITNIGAKEEKKPVELAASQPEPSQEAALTPAQSHWIEQAEDDNEQEVNNQPGYQEPSVEPEVEMPKEDYVINCFNCRFYYLDRKNREQFYCMALEQVCQGNELDMPCVGELHKEEVAGICNCCGR